MANPVRRRARVAARLRAPLSFMATALVTTALVACASSQAGPQATATPPAPSAAPSGYHLAAGPGGHIKEFGTMWTFEAPPLAYWKSQYNFAPDIKWLDHVRLAAVRLPNCSASFVSGRGLVMTNHHCGRSCTDAVSPRDTNYIETGFSAPTLADERKCPALYVDQLQSIEDVTARIRSAVTAQTPSGQVAQRDAAIAGVEHDCTERTKLRCQVVSLYQGGVYSLYRYKRFDDLRLVMAPEGDIAFYGGDPDNFTYPRYDLDLTLLRVYENDRPYSPPDYLRWSAHGAGDSDLVFVVGNPGNTGRLLTVAQLQYLRDGQYPAVLKAFRRTLDALHRRAAQSPEAARALQNTIFGLANSHKAIFGYETGLRDSGLMARKQAFETDFRRRIAADASLQSQYGGAWDAIAQADQRLTPLIPRLVYYRGVPNLELVTDAVAIVQITSAPSVPDSARPAPLRGEGLTKARAGLLDDHPIDLDLQEMLLAAQLRDAQQDLGPNDPYVRAALNGQAPEAAARRLVRGTTIATAAGRRALLDGGPSAVAQSTDPLIVVARAMEPALRELGTQFGQQQAVISVNGERIGRAIFAAYGRALPPDATFTLRISDGVVHGYPMNGTEAPYKTTFWGLYERAADFDDTPPFKLPVRWRDRRDRLDLATPFDIVTTNDIIGGNSGSPVVNRSAEVVGLIFDGNIESLPNNFIYTDDVARAVSVSSRGITEALRKLYDGGGRLADELEGKSPPG